MNRRRAWDRVRQQGTACLDQPGTVVVLHIGSLGIDGLAGLHRPAGPHVAHRETVGLGIDCDEGYEQLVQPKVEIGAGRHRVP